MSREQERHIENMRRREAQSAEANAARKREHQAFTERFEDRVKDKLVPHVWKDLKDSGMI